MRLIEGGWVDRGDGGRRTRLSQPDTCLWCLEPTQRGEVFRRDDGTIAEVGCCARCWMRYRPHWDHGSLQVISGGLVA